MHLQISCTAEVGGSARKEGGLSRGMMKEWCAGFYYVGLRRGV
jgi:hypothetical protein